MTAKEYQQQAGRTMIERPGFDVNEKQMMLVWNALGLAGEAGEVADLVKKGVFHRHGIDREKLKNELGDVLWYTTALCSSLGLELEEVMTANITKLEKRYPNGFTPEDSINR